MQENRIKLNEMGERLRDLRLDENMTQQMLAKRWNCERTLISAHENGKKCITVDRLVDYINTFHVSAEYILFGKEQENNVLL